ncbi:hypothetical protein EJB05_03973 [Eragrostis curvula]|uniref:Bifunctional inhibitor/plant lipid transfer protein/seed storage helical domain-containing protein n=1 Tax=Eragrostis curvula TaxID=38414 RepID=A0A5J9W8R5_9POAL|nr:hypothetical protein EJB05_03973 [Eragrostis curvula]
MASNSVQSRSSSAAVMALLVVLAMAAGPAVVRGDFAADRAECADKLMGLATCVTYVQAKATAREPTPDCCAGLKQVVTASKKCLCVLVKDRNEPALGIQINVTRAMDLPDTCNFPAIFSDCPKILNMSPDSPDAEIFQEYAKKHESGQNGTAAATGGAGGKSSSTATTAPTGAAGAGRQPCTLFFFLVSALLAAISILA